MVAFVIGIVVLATVTEIFPQAAPSYDETFPVGSAPYQYDTSNSGLTGIVVRQKLSDNSWVTISSSDYTYSGTTVTVDAGALYV